MDAVTTECITHFYHIKRENEWLMYAIILQGKNADLP